MLKQELQGSTPNVTPTEFRTAAQTLGQGLAMNRSHGSSDEVLRVIQNAPMGKAQLGN